MKTEDTKFETWICHRRQMSAETRTLADGVLERIRSTEMELERGRQADAGAKIPKPAFAAVCLLVGLAKVWIALRLAF